MAEPATPHLHLRLVVRQNLARRPEAWVYAVALVAAAALLGQIASSASPHIPIEDPPAWLAAWSGWMLMVLAMMLPVIAPDARRIAMRSLWRRRHRAMVGYLCGYLAVWAVVGLVIVGVLHVAHQPHPPAGVTVAALLGAARWQTSGPRRRVMRRCGLTRLGAAQGTAADRDCAAAGLVAGLRCTVTCGPVMLTMALGHHYSALMVGLLVLLLSERARGPNPERRAGRPLEAWCLVGVAVLLTFAAFT